MKLRILRKKIKNDVLIRLWLRHWYWSSQYSLYFWTHEYQLNELGKILAPIYQWMDNYEMEQVCKIVEKKYHAKGNDFVRIGFPYIARQIIKQDKKHGKTS